MGASVTATREPAADVAGGLTPAKDWAASADPDDTVGLYIREISRFSLLTAEQEIALARAIEEGQEARVRLREQASRDERERRRLGDLIRWGRMARRGLIVANFRLVISLAKRYMGRGVWFADLIQEGNLGLMRAVELYDHRRGVRFSTYATWWIRQAISRSVADQGRTIRLPAHVCERIGRLRRFRRELEQKLGREPSSEEVAAVAGLTREEIDRITRLTQEPISLETPLGSETDSELLDFIEDQDTPSVALTASRLLLHEEMARLLALLTARESRVLQLRFGLNDGCTHTLEEVSREFGVTRERIRQIESRALAKLRQPGPIRGLRGYLES